MTVDPADTDPAGFRRPQFAPDTPPEVRKAVEAGTAERLDEARSLWRSIRFQEGVVERLRVAKPIPKEKGTKFAPAISPEQIAGRLKEATDELTGYRDRLDALRMNVAFVPAHAAPPRPGAIGRLPGGAVETKTALPDGVLIHRGDTLAVLKPASAVEAVGGPLRCLGPVEVKIADGIRAVSAFEPVRLDRWVTPAVEIVGHRGASWDAPENTVASVKLAWQQRADAAEFDVYLSKDGQLVVLHDQSLKRTTGVDRPVTDLTAAELGALDAGKWKGEKFAGEPVPTLAAVLATVPAGKRVFIEVKCGPEAVPELDRVLKASGLKTGQTAVISFSAEVIAAVKKARPDLVAYWIVSLATKKGEPPTAAALIAKAKAIKADGLDLSATPAVLTPAFARAVREAGLGLWVWTVNDPELARTMIAAGVDGLTTDRPGWLRGRLADPPLRVLSCNIHHGEGTDGRIDLQRLAAVIRAADPDLVALQEVDDRTRRSGGVDQTSELARLTGLHGRFGKQLDYDGGGYGQAVLSRQPPGEATVHWLPGTPDRERRIAFAVKASAGGREVLFVTTHLHHQNAGFREQQVAELTRLFADADRPVILAGDLNATPDATAVKNLADRWASAGDGLLTFPAGTPAKQLDYVFTRSADRFRASGASVPAEPTASDHRPVLVVLRPPAN